VPIQADAVASPATNTDCIIDSASRSRPGTAKDKRDKTRHPYPMPVRLTLLNPLGGTTGPSQQVQAIDLSQGGIRIRSRAMFHIGTKGIMELTRSDGTSKRVGVCVRHCRYKGDLTHETGFMFTPLDSDVDE